jgi:hypothetical protein
MRRQGVAHRTLDADIGRRAVGGVAGAHPFFVVHFGELGFDHVGQRQVVEEKLQEFVARELEDEFVHGLFVGIGGAAAPAAAALRRAGNAVAGDEFLVARLDHLAAPARAVVEAGLGDVFGRDVDLLALVDVGDAALADRLGHPRVDREEHRTPVVPGVERLQ